MNRKIKQLVSRETTGESTPFLHAGEIERWLGELGLDVVTLKPSGAVEFFEARLPFREQAQ